MTEATHDYILTPSNHVAPPWVGWLLLLPLRKRWESARRLMGHLVSPGSTVLEVGPAMGFHTLDLARMVGPEGRVIAADVQASMLAALRRRARRKGLADRIDTRLVDHDGRQLSELAGQVDLAVLFNVLHEASDREGLARTLRASLRPGGKLYFAEPKAHVPAGMFEAEIALLERAGFEVESKTEWGSGKAVVLR